MFGFLEGATAQDDANTPTYNFAKFYKNYIEKILIRSGDRIRMQETYSAIYQAVADPGFSWGGASTSKVGVLTYYFAGPWRAPFIHRYLAFFCSHAKISFLIIDMERFCTRDVLTDNRGIVDKSVNSNHISLDKNAFQ